MRKVLFFIFIISFCFYNCYALDLDCSISLSAGSSGSDVEKVQTLLNMRNKCGLMVDGVFGSRTFECVKDFQKKNNIEADGVVGPITCNYLIGNTPVVTYKNTRFIYGIVLGDKVNIRSGANINSKVINTPSFGKILTVSSKSGNWYKIKYDNGKIGYINDEFFSTSFILVDKSSQKLYYFSDGIRKWSTNVVTGMKNSHDTPTGFYTLNKDNFVSKTYLSGYNDDFTRYNSYVDYWMPFILSSGIGFHDATWRDYNQFNKDEYINNGSHGCVNMHHEAAQKLFNESFSTIDVVVRD